MEQFNPESSHEYFLRKTLELAKSGEGHVAPNPLVGALLTREGRILGTGFHARYGGPHAEVVAIDELEKQGLSAEGATLYCNLEPCCHTNKQTPPCADLIIQKKIKKVVFISLDPNEFVSGKGAEKLRKAGIEVEHGLFERENEQLNEVYFKFIRTQIPFIHLKWAQTLDGKMGTLKGDSKWISNEEARREAHRLRGRYGAVGIGTGTLRLDNPQLDIRFGLERDFPTPFRIVFGREVQERDLASKVFTDHIREKTILITQKSQHFFESLEEKGIKVITLDESGGDEESFLRAGLAELGRMKISGILVEGGPKLHASFLKHHLADKLTIFIAPKLLGKGIDPFHIWKKEKIQEAIELKDLDIKVLQDNIMITGSFR